MHDTLVAPGLTYDQAAGGDVPTLDLLVVAADRRACDEITAVLAGVGSLAIAGRLHTVAVRGCESLAAALGRLAENSPGVVLLHLDSPWSEDAASVLEAFAAAAPEVPLVVLTNRSEIQLLGAGLDVRGHAVVGAAPLVARELAAAVRFAAEVSRHLRRAADLASALCAHEARFRSLIERSADGVLLIDGLGVIRHANPAAQRLFARSGGDLLGSPLGWPVVAGEALELDVRRTDGTFAVVELRVAESEWEGEPATLVTLRDVTERISHAEAIRTAHSRTEAQARRIEGILDASPDAVAEIAADGRFLYVSRRLAEECGIEAAAMLGHTARELGLPADWTRGVDELREVAARERRMLSRDVRTHTASGERWIVHTVLPLAASEDGPGSVLLVARDVTDQKVAEQDLRRSDARFRSVFESAPAGIAILAADGRILDSNQSLGRMLGTPERSLPGTPLRVFVHHDDRAASDSLLDLVRREAAATPSASCRIIRLDGAVVSVQLTVSAVRDDAWGHHFYVAVLADLSEVRNLEGQLLRAQKMEAIGRLAGGVAHDFNNLLTAAIAFSDLTIARTRPGEAVRGYAENTKRTLERAAVLTRQLLAFGRKQVLEPRVISLTETVREFTKILHRLIGEDIETRYFLADDLWLVKLDPAQFEQVVMNLVVNARDAMPDGGKLTIETANVVLDAAYAARHPGVTPGEYAMVAVSDNGVGMDSETQARIFEPFFTTKELGRGTGLGLSTVFGIVRQSGGHIFVYSEPGRGSTFKLYFRRTDERPAQPTPRGATAGSGARSAPATILIAEDDDQLRTLLHDFLVEAGFTVLAARDGAEALALCEGHRGRVDIVLTDVVMPRMGGREAVEKIRTTRPETQVVFMSGYTTNGVFHQGILPEGVDFMAKPFTFDALTAKIEEVLARPAPGSRT